VPESSESRYDTQHHQQWRQRAEQIYPWVHVGDRRTNEQTNRRRVKPAQWLLASKCVVNGCLHSSECCVFNLFVIMIRYYIITMSPWRHELTDCSLAQPQRKYCSTVAHEWMMTCVAGDCVLSSSQTWTYIDRLMRLPNVIWQRLLWQ